MNLGPPLHSTKPFKARPSSSAFPTFPDVIIVKHFFSPHLVIQAKVTNNSFAVEGRSLGNLAFVVAESSEDAIQPAPSTVQVPIKVLSCNRTLRYTVLGVDVASGTSLGLSLGQGTTTRRTFVEELQDVEAFASHF